jgi:uncharacterized protein (DUF488 family)
MEVFTIGFTKKSAEEFFGLLRRHGIRRLVDVRLNNVSQLAGFAKRDDLRFFLREICAAEYVHEPLLAPTQEMLDEYKKRGGAWKAYETAFLELMASRRIEDRIPKPLLSAPSVLLCSEPTAENCHRRLIVEYLNEKWGGLIAHHL